jgi:hypothetical protein
MKKNYLLLFLLVNSYCTSAQIVTIPDPFFKNALVNENVVDFDGDGIPESDADTNNDGEIQLSEAEAVIYFYPRAEEIQSLEGIESFVNIEILNCSQNSLTTLDLSQNPNLRRLSCFLNNLTSINVTQNTLLEELNCDLNELNGIDVSQNTNLERFWFTSNSVDSIDLSQNPNLIDLNAEYNNLMSLDLTQNPNLEILSFDNNDISTIDLSQNPNLRIVDLHNNLLMGLDISQNPLVTKVWCYSNQFESLNIQNGNNLAFTGFNAENNPLLSCIQVDDEAYANGQTNWVKDEMASYSENCALGITDVAETFSGIICYPNPAADIIFFKNTKELAIRSIRIYDVLGRKLLHKDHNFDEIDISVYSSGALFVRIDTQHGEFVKKIIKTASF